MKYHRRQGVDGEIALEKSIGFRTVFHTLYGSLTRCFLREDIQLYQKNGYAGNIADNRSFSYTLKISLRINPLFRGRHTARCRSPPGFQIFAAKSLESKEE